MLLLSNRNNDYLCLMHRGAIKMNNYRIMKPIHIYTDNKQCVNPNLFNATVVQCEDLGINTVP